MWPCWPGPVSELLGVEAIDVTAARQIGEELADRVNVAKVIS
jgi:hypothetical protein